MASMRPKSFLDSNISKEIEKISTTSSEKKVLKNVSNLNSTQHKNALKEAEISLNTTGQTTSEAQKWAVIEQIAQDSLKSLNETSKSEISQKTRQMSNDSNSAIKEVEDNKNTDNQVDPTPQRIKLFDEQIMEVIAKAEKYNKGSNNMDFRNPIEKIVRDKIKSERDKIYNAEDNKNQVNSQDTQNADTSNKEFAQAEKEHSIKEQIYILYRGISQWHKDIISRAKSENNRISELFVKNIAEQKAQSHNDRHEEFKLGVISTFSNELKDAAEYESKWEALRPHTSIDQRNKSRETLKTYYRIYDDIERDLNQILGKAHTPLEKLKQHYTTALQEEKNLSWWEKQKRNRDRENPQKETNFIGFEKFLNRQATGKTPEELLMETWKRNEE